MHCSISGRVPSDPVVAKSSGCLFDRSLVERYIAENGRCPVTGEPLSADDLLPIRVAASPSSSSSSPGLAAASIPGLIDRMRAEWDSLMLEQFTLRQQLAQHQQELAHALQQHEAACRVIASLSKECESLRRRVPAASAAAGEVDVEGAVPARAAFPPGLQAMMDDAEAAQQRQRKQRATSGAVAATDRLSARAEGVSVAAGGAAGLALLEHTGAAGGGCIVTADVASHRVLQYCLTRGRVVGAGAGHEGPVHSVTTTPAGEHILSAGADSTVRVWRPHDHAAAASHATPATASLVCEQVLRYAGGVSALSRRGIGQQYIFSGSRSGAVYLSDLSRGEHVLISDVHDDDADVDDNVVGSKRRRASTGRRNAHAVAAVELHPYTKIAGIGTDAGELFIWNVQEEVVDTAVAVHAAAGRSSARVCSLDFSLDCVTLAAGLSNGCALVWDLRKIESPLATLAAPGGGDGRQGPATVAFDGGNGGALAVGCGAAVRVWRVADVATDGAAPLELALDGTAVSGLCWGGGVLAAAGLDGVVKVYGE